MKTLLAGLLALATLGGAAASLAPGALLSVGAADPACTDLAGQADICQEISADPASGVNADVTADVHPTPPVAAAAMDPECTDVAGQADLCQEISADPASGVNVYVTADVHPTPPV